MDGIMETLPEGTSLATVGSVIGVVGGPPGILLGAAIGDTIISARKKKKARKRMRRAFLALILKRYQTQVFISTLERLAMAMLHIAELKVKPGTEQYDKLLQKLLYTEIGYKGDCSVMILGPSKPGTKRQVLAVIDRDKMTSYSALDPSLGKKWHEACKELHKAALRAWAEDKAIDILEERERKHESAEAKRRTATRAMVNGGIILVLLGYSIRKKRKLKERGVS